ncbi:hypothetical protein TeGR_g12358, partial [Tetraparma gracilis]
MSLTLFLSLLHISLHPFVSISTFEPKLRGFYIDENAVSSTLSSVNPSIKGRRYRRSVGCEPDLPSFCTLLNSLPLSGRSLLSPACFSSPTSVNATLHPSAATHPGGGFHVHFQSVATPGLLCFLRDYAEELLEGG